MEIGFVNTTFQAIDKSPYERWINDGKFDDNKPHLVVHRLLSVKDGESPTVIRLTYTTLGTTPEAMRNPFEVSGLTNGLYYYQKLIIPFDNHLSGANEHLYCKSTDGKIYYEDADSETSEIYNLTNIDQFDEVYEIVRKNYPDNCFYFDDYSFTIYDLIECYVLAEKDRINNYLKNNCNGNCSNGGSDSNSRTDVLLAAVMVLKDLMEKGDYFEAQRILNGLNTCGNLCKKYANNLNDCGCGRS